MRNGNRKIFAYLRIHQEQVILGVANLSHSPQPVELDLAEYKGRVPLELTSRTSFPPIGEWNYLLTLPRYGFYWFELSMEAPAPTWHEELPPLEAVPVLVLSEARSFFVQRSQAMRGFEELSAEGVRRRLEEAILPRYLEGQRWFAGKASDVARTCFNALGVWQTSQGRWLLDLIKVTLADGQEQTYFLPFTLRWEGPEELRKGSSLKEVAGMLRSFDYAAATAFGSCHGESPAAYTAIQHLLKSWRHAVKAAFLEGYRAGVEGCPSQPAQPWQADRLIGLFRLEKALYEVRYELANRPQWVPIPLADVVELTDENDTEERHD